MGRGVTGTARQYEDNVFLNVPFDSKYEPIFRALVFAVHDCGFISRCALEEDNAANVRVDKIYKIIEESRFGIHDISRTTLDSATRLPRFNMPLELGLFLGAKEFGGANQRRKNCLVLDSHKYRYQKFCSDISGQDIRAHNHNGDSAIAVVRDWLSTARRHPRGFIPGGNDMAARYHQFRRYLPLACKQNRLSTRKLTFFDFRMLLIGWLQQNDW